MTSLWRKAQCIEQVLPFMTLALMKTLVVVLVIFGAAQAADTSALPPEVKSYIED